ncbi:MAG: hypothetical protein FD135_2831 [Comamonadaceae bacterium]|nr:MAG: hypothetical protein FD135_2831 [Comamonadaceae bacterium]
MQKQRRNLLTLLTTLTPFGFVSSSSWAQNAKTAAASPSSLTLGLHAAVTKVTRLSVLTDRIGRGHAQRVLEVLPKRSGKIIAESSQEARKLLNELVSVNYAAPSKAQFGKVSKDYELLLQSSERFTSTEKTDLAKFGHQADNLGGEVDKLVEFLIKELGKPVAQVLSATADLQRLTQHLAVHFLLAHVGTEIKEQQKLLFEGIDEFNHQFKAIQAAALKNSQIEQSLQLIGNQWFLMSQSLKSSEKDAITMENVCTTSERTLEVLNELYAHYETALKSLIG